jgi:hypothetical protein
MSNQNINSDSNNNTSTNNTFINLLQELIELDNTEQDIENLIPCEFCNHLIHINNYERHSRMCHERFQLRNRMYMNMINRRRDREILQEGSNNNNISDNNLNTSLNYASVNNSDSDSDDERYYNIDDSVEMDGIEGLSSDNELDNLQSNNDFEDYINLNSIENNQEDNQENNDDTSSDDLLQDLPELIETNTNNTNNTNNTRSTRNIENIHLLYVDIMRDRIYNNNSFRTMLRSIVDNTSTESSEYSSLFVNNNFERLMDTITNSIIRVPRIPLDFNKIFTNIDKKDLDNTEECPICYESMNELNDDNNVVKILCNHKFCKKCISEWLNTNDYCPMCKKNMRNMTITKEDDMDIENYIEENDNTIS